MMRSILAVMTISAALAPAGAQTVAWTSQFGSQGKDEAFSVAVSSNAVYAGGETLGTVSGGTNAGRSDGFVTKLDLQGAHVWTVQFGTAENDNIAGVAADATGVYVVGYTNGAFPGSTNLGSSDIFIRKYDTNGNVAWTQQFGTTGADIAGAAAVDGAGVYVTGKVAGALPGQTRVGGDDVFIRKYDLAGNETWTRQFGTVDNEQGFGIAVDTSGVYVTGTTAGNFAAPPQGRDGFLRKYTQDGTIVWTRQFGSSTTDDFTGVAVNSSGVYVSGGTTGTIPNQTKQGGLWDALVYKFDLNGTAVWSRQLGTASDDYAYGVSAAQQWVYVAGYSSSSLAVWRYDINGNDTGNVTRGTFATYCYGAAADGSGAYVTGASGGMHVGPNPIGDQDGFVMKIPHPPLLSGLSDAFTGQPGVAPSTWIALYGTNLSAATRTWDGAISGTQLPTTLDGLGVRINNKPATTYFVSPGQVNVLAPLEDVTGPVQVTLTNPYGTSPALNVTAGAVLPAFYAPFGESKGLQVTAVALDGTLVGKPGIDPRVGRPMRPGEVVQFFATGFGKTNPVAPSDVIFTGAPEVVTKPRITIGGREASIIGNGNLVGAGLYQFNLTIPDLPDGDHVIQAEIGTVRSLGTVFLAVKR